VVSDAANDAAPHTPETVSFLHMGVAIIQRKPAATEFESAKIKIGVIA
jgi:hypothetical protein